MSIHIGICTGLVIVMGSHVCVYEHVHVYMYMCMYTGIVPGAWAYVHVHRHGQAGRYARRGLIQPVVMAD